MLERFRQRTLDASQAGAQLSLSPSRLYALAAAYNTARARKQKPLWTPGRFRRRPCARLAAARGRTPQKAPGLLAPVSLQLRRLRSPPASFLQARPRRTCPKSSPPVRRWQCANIGELWQLDASPHRWFPHSKQLFPMLHRLDDGSRLFPGSKIYERELLLSYFDFLPAAFLAHGRPLQL